MKNRFAVLSLAVTMACSGGQEIPATATTSGVVSVEGVDFRYVREGRGIPAVVIGSSLHYPRVYSETLRDSFDFIFVDSRHFMPSYQPSDAELEGLSLGTWADDVEALREHLGIEEWAVFGHSAQAQIALAYAQRYPQRTSRLVLIAGSPYAGNDVGEASRQLWEDQASAARKEQHARNREGLTELLEETAPSRRFAVRYIANAARYWVDPTYDSTPLWEGVETSSALGRLITLIPSRAEVRAALEGFAAPTLVVVGKGDYIVPYTIWEPLIEGLPNVTYVLLEEDGHNPQTEAPERFDPVLIDWVTR